MSQKTPFAAPFLSIPVTLLSHPKFVAFTSVDHLGPKHAPFFLLLYAAAHCRDGSFTGFSPLQWCEVFRYFGKPYPGDKKNAYTNLVMDLVKRFVETGWLDEDWNLDPELFQDYNGRLVEQSEEASAQKSFNAGKRWHPERVDDDAANFFSRFGRWPKGYVAPAGEPQLPTQRPADQPGDGEQPPEAESPPLVATKGGLESRTKTQPRTSVPAAKTAQAGSLFKPEKKGLATPSPSQRLWAANQGLKTATGKARKELQAQADAAVEALTGVAIRSATPKPTPAPAKAPAKAPAIRAMTPLEIAKVWLETPDMLRAGHVETLRAAGVKLPAEVAARFPLSVPTKTKTKK